MSEGSKPKVVILGGGVGAITAAFELSRPGWEKVYESITVYQLGWRLGGKGASGRGDHGRIEEHGLHVWFGFYENAFRMMRECYEELGRDVQKPEDQNWSQLTSINTAFLKASKIVAEENLPGGWVPWVVEFEENDEEPGTARSTADLVTPWKCVVQAVELAGDFLESAIRKPQEPVAPMAGVRLHGLGGHAGPEGQVILRQGTRSTAHRVFRAATESWRRAQRSTGLVTRAVLAQVLAVLNDFNSDDTDHSTEDHSPLARSLGVLADRVRDHIKAEVLESDDARRQWYLADVLLACARGIISHGLLTHPAGFDSIDEFDFIDWLILNGADRESAQSTMVRTAAYDLPFAYREGDPAKPSIAAGAALRGLCRMFFTYKGALAWKMRAGMGDIVFAPLYLVLKERGVEFEFFQRVTGVRVDPNDPYMINRIELERQPVGVDVSDYRPLTTVKGRPCWPARPLVDVDDPASFEKSVGGPPGERWELAVAPDDKVVLGIALGVLPTICKDLIDDHPAWKRMIDAVERVPTQAFQLWLKDSFAGLEAEGARADERSEGLRFITSGGYVEPFDTWADMSHLIDVEDWPEGERPQAIAYLCNVLPGVDLDPKAPPPSQEYWDAVVKRNAEAFLRNYALHLWPKAYTRYPDEFRWDLLVDPAGGDKRDRFDTQFFQANVDPSSLYVLSVPGSGRHRLAPDDSGYDNLFLAGDWTRNGLDLGCVESAVMSGMLAAAAIRGDKDRSWIVGFDHLGRVREDRERETRRGL